MKIRPLEPNTRLRADHNTAGTIIYPDLIPSDILEGTEIFTAPVDFTYNGSVIQFVGDKWLHVEKMNGSPLAGWVAITNKAIQICEEIVDTPPVSGQFPQKFKLTNVETNESAEYVRA